MFRQFVSFLAVVGLLFLASCGEPSELPVETPKGPLNIVCTTGMVADLVQNVVGNDAKVSFLIPSGIDPHTYKASQGDVSAISNADVVIYSGLDLEAKLESVLENFGKRPDKTVLSLGEGLDPSRLIQVSEGGEVDPHFWFDVPLWSSAVMPIAKSLGTLDRAHAEAFSQRASDYQATLAELDTWVKSTIDLVPQEQRVMVTVHDAFSYLGRAYDVEVRGLMGVSPAVEPGLQDMSALVNYLTEAHIPAVFVEASLATRTMETVVEQCAANGHNVKLGGTLHADSTGPEGTPEATYEGMVRSNITTIVNALR